MDRQTSLYLDIVRFTAAMVVFLGHIGGQRLTGGMFWQLGSYTSQAVTVFFVLSGFVIAFVTDEREPSASKYAISRLARIYSVALPVLMSTYMLDTIGRGVNPAAYSSSWGFQSDGQIWRFFSCLVFVNQFWFLSVVPGSDLPYWSLGFEVWYYVIFGVMLFARRPLGWSLLIMLAVGPAVTALFPLWMLGVGTYRAGRLRIRAWFGLAMWLGAAAAWAGYMCLARQTLHLYGTVPAFLKRPEFLEDYIVGVLFALHLAGFRAASRHFATPLGRMAPAIRWAAGYTFTLYLLHLPLAQMLAAISPWPAASWQNRALVLLGTLAGVITAAEVTERRKDLWRNGFARLFGFCCKDRP